jgi:hypothetical protein
MYLTPFEPAGLAMIGWVLLVLLLSWSVTRWVAATAALPFHGSGPVLARPVVRARALPLLLALALAPAAAGAQSETAPIRPGERVTGVVAPSDPDAFGRGPFRAFAADLREGDRLLAEATSADFDTYLVVGRMAGPVFEHVASDDDGGEGTDSRLHLVVPRDGRYLFLVQSFRAEGRGAFTLRLERRPEPTTGAPRPIAQGSTVDGTLAASDREDERGRFYDVYTFTGRAGERIVATLDSDALDARLVLGRMDGGRMVRVARDDDGGAGRNARLRYTLRADGEYVLHATSYRSGETGPYRLGFRTRLPVPPRSLRRGERVSARLTANDMESDDGAYYQEWTFSGREGERIRIDMVSAELDTYVYLGRVRDGTFQELASDDDGGEGTNSRLEFILPATGTYVVRASSYAEAETGAYTLLIQGARR